MAALQARSSPPEKSTGSRGRGASVATALQRDGDPDESQVLSTLRELVAAGEHRLDPMLAAISDAALRLTGATGVALAMWKEGAMVCRARSGETAPLLGAQLRADTGISGECLRTGKSQICVDTEKNKLVDVEVCRTLALRSIAVSPIHGERGNNGILEAFSTEPGAFTSHHLAVLEQLALLAERARSAKPVGASPVAAPTVVRAPERTPGRTGLLPASDRVADFVRAVVGQRRLLLGVAGLALAFLLGLMIWLGWRGSDGNERKAQAAAPVAAEKSNAASASVATKAADSWIAGQHVPDNDAVWKPNPGGQLVAASGKPSAARTVKLYAAEAQRTTKDVQPRDVRAGDARTSLRITANEVPGAGVGVTPAGGGSAAAGNLNGSSRGATRSGAAGSAAASKEEPAVLEPPVLGAGQAAPAITGVLSSQQPLMPTLSQQRVSKGISGGQLIHRVPPEYPSQAKSLRMEGKVVLNAVVLENGRVGDLKLVQGDPVFVASAMDAVKRWRYKPFVLDGKAVKSPMTITLDFKLPR